MWVKDHKFLAVWRGVRIMPPFQGFSVNQICTSINLSWEHLAQKKLWCISDVVHGVGGVLAEVHSTAVISYPGNENIISKETAWCHTRWLNQPALAQSRRIKPRQGDESEDGARRSKNWFDQRQRKKLSIGSRVQSFPHAFAFLFDVALSLVNLPVLFREYQGVTTSDTPKRHTHWCLWNNKSIGEGWTTSI